MTKEVKDQILALRDAGVWMGDRDEVFRRALMKGYYDLASYVAYHEAEYRRFIHVGKGYREGLHDYGMTIASL